MVCQTSTYRRPLRRAICEVKVQIYQAIIPLPPFPRWSMLLINVLRDSDASLPWLDFLMPMRCHKLRFGGGGTGSLGSEGKLGVDATVGDTALVEGLLDSDSEPSFRPPPSSGKTSAPICSSSFISSHSSMLVRLSIFVGCERGNTVWVGEG
jgi:hypothetical protein